jgi:hypothetical protein
MRPSPLHVLLLAVPTLALSGEDACEGRGYDVAGCSAVGCCQWDDDECWSEVGTDDCKGGSDPEDGEEEGGCNGLPPCACGCATSPPDTCFSANAISFCFTSSCGDSFSDLSAANEILEPYRACLCEGECGGGETNNGGVPCLDEYAELLGVRALPFDTPSSYRAHFCSYTEVIAPNGKPIKIYGQSEVHSLQLYRARSILAFYLEAYSCPDLPASSTCHGADKSLIANSMADNGAILDMPNGAHEAPGAGQSLYGQEL